MIRKDRSSASLAVGRIVILKCPDISMVKQLRIRPSDRITFALQRVHFRTDLCDWTKGKR